MTEENRVLKVRGGTDCHKLAHAIAGDVERGKEPVIEFIGAGACNQSIKAIAIANSIIAKMGQKLLFTPSFQRRKLKDNDKAVAMQLHCHVYPL